MTNHPQFLPNHNKTTVKKTEKKPCLTIQIYARNV